MVFWVPCPITHRYENVSMVREMKSCYAGVHVLLVIWIVNQIRKMFHCDRGAGDRWVASFYPFVYLYFSRSSHCINNGSASARNAMNASMKLFCCILADLALRPKMHRDAQDEADSSPMLRSCDACKLQSFKARQKKILKMLTQKSMHFDRKYL